MKNKNTYMTKELNEMLENVSEYCRANNIPLFMATVDTDTEKETKYLFECISPKVNGISLSNDIFPDLINVVNGFQTIPPREVLQFDFDTEEMTELPDIQSSTQEM